MHAEAILPIPAADLDAYIREISVIADTFVSEATTYAKYRAIGEGFQKNVDWIEFTSPPSISFFNGLTAMLDLAIVMAAWKMTEEVGDNSLLLVPGEIAARSAPNKRREHDELRSLPRMVHLFRSAFRDTPENFRTWFSQRQQEIVSQFSLPARNIDDYAEAIETSHQNLLVWCDKVDALMQSDARKTLDIVRNQGFAHSSAISRKLIRTRRQHDQVDFKRSVLFSLGDEAMQLALEFENVWFQRGRATLQDLISQNAAVGATFWADAKKGLAPEAQ